MKNWRWWSRPQPSVTPTPSGPLAVKLGPEQAHAIDLCWVDTFMADLRPHVVVRPEDDLLILVPNRPTKLNRTAIRVLQALLDEGVGIHEVLRREGDSPARRRELHWFFSDLQALLSGHLGEGHGRRAVVQEPFKADFCAYPVLSEVALTYRCNLSCAFCYAGCSRGGLPPGWREDRCLDDEQVCRVLEIIRRDARCPSVSFTGGEPTLHPSLPRFVAHAKAVGLKVNLISNGQRLDARLADALHAAGLDSAQLSLEGPDAATHDGLVGRAGAFERLWAALEHLRQRGIQVHTNTTVNQANLGLLCDIVDTVAARGQDRLTMNLVIPCGTAGEPAAGDGVTVPYSRVGEHILRARDHAQRQGVRFIWYSPLPFCVFNPAAEGLGSPGCAAADGLLHVNPAGHVLPCSSFRHDESLGDLLHEPFEAVWQSAAARFFRQKHMVPQVCSACDKVHICQGACTLYWRTRGMAEIDPARDAPLRRPPAPAGFGVLEGCPCAGEADDGVAPQQPSS